MIDQLLILCSSSKGDYLCAERLHQLSVEFGYQPAVLSEDFYRLIQEALRSLLFSAQAVCCIIFSTPSEAMPSQENAKMADRFRELTSLLQPEQSRSSSFQISEWYQINGSGGFEENFSDEHRFPNEWEMKPDE
jgi:hypothetical protein